MMTLHQLSFPIHFPLIAISVSTLIYITIVATVSGRSPQSADTDEPKWVLPKCNAETCFITNHECGKRNGVAVGFGYQFNTKTLKCEHSTDEGICFKNTTIHTDLFSDMGTCKKACGFCPTLLNSYTEDDDCLKTVKSFGKSTNEVEYWYFVQQLNACNSTRKLFNDGLKTKRGLAFPTKEECETKCPPMQINS